MTSCFCETQISLERRNAYYSGQKALSLKWAPFVFRKLFIYLFIFFWGGGGGGGSTSGLMLIGSWPHDTFVFFECFEFFSRTV